MSLATGYRVAAGTLAAEGVLAVGLLSPTFGLFAIFLMVVVGVAWIPAAAMIFKGAGDSPGRSGLARLAASACGILGVACLYLLLKWILLSFATS
jgi:hypothetical protein